MYIEHDCEQQSEFVEHGPFIGWHESGLIWLVAISSGTAKLPASGALPEKMPSKVPIITPSHTFGCDANWSSVSDTSHRVDLSITCQPFWYSSTAQPTVPFGGYES